jgi:hypothetical protein
MISKWTTFKFTFIYVIPIIKVPWVTTYKPISNEHKYKKETKVSKWPT